MNLLVSNGNNSILLFLIFLTFLFWMIPIIMLIVGIIRLKKRPKNAKDLIIIAGVWLVIGGGACGSVFF